MPLEERERVDTDSVRQILVLVVFGLCCCGLFFDDFVRSALAPSGSGSVDFLGGTSCAIWPTEPVYDRKGRHKNNRICAKNSGVNRTTETPWEKGSDDPGSLRGLIHLVDRRGRCGKKTCALLLPSLDAQFASRTTLAALGAAVHCKGIDFRLNRVLDDHGKCAPVSGYRRFVWWFFYSVQLLELSGFAAGMYGAARPWGVLPAGWLQVLGLRYLVATQVLHVVTDVVLLVFFKFTIAPHVGMDADRVHLQLWPLGPRSWPAALGYFACCGAFVAAVGTLLRLDHLQHRYAEVKDDGAVPLLGIILPPGAARMRGGVREAVRRANRKTGVAAEDRPSPRPTVSPRLSPLPLGRGPVENPLRPRQRVPTDVTNPMLERSRTRASTAGDVTGRAVD